MTRICFESPFLQRTGGRRPREGVGDDRKRAEEQGTDQCSVTLRLNNRDLTHIHDGDGEDDAWQKNVSILLWDFSFVEIYPVCLSVLKLAPAEYATNAFSSK